MSKRTPQHLTESALTTHAVNAVNAVAYVAAGFAIGMLNGPPSARFVLVFAVGFLFLRSVEMLLVRL